MLPGQGSIYPGMLNELYLNRSHHWPEWIWGEKILNKFGIDAAAILFEAPRGSPRELATRTTHPTTFVIHYCLGKLLERKYGKPSAYLGYSLGEITSLALAGYIDPETTVEALVKIGDVCDCHSADEGMLAIVEDLTIRDDYYPLFDKTEIACSNYPGHHVIAGPSKNLDRIARILKSKDIIHERLAVRSAFHSSYMCPAEAQLKKFQLEQQSHGDLPPVYSCFLARPYENVDFHPDHIWNLHREPVHFEKTFLKTIPEATFLDVSATGTLATFARQLCRARTSEVVQTFSPWGNELQQFERINTQIPCLS